MRTIQGGRLRTKTGCLTCRSRRKKCDERYPKCQRCLASSRECQWPTADELIDRRHILRRASTASSQTLGPDSPQGVDLPIFAFNQASESISMQSESVAGQIVLRDVEPLVSANFFDKYFDMIVLPNCHPQFYHGWIAEIKQLMTQHPSLYYSVLACSASQVHSLSGTQQMHGLSLEYYDRSIKGVLQLLEVESVATHNGLLMSIILLYLHGCLGLATFTDVPRHVEAAIRLLRLRHFCGNGTIWQPFDRIAVESVLYQIFLTAMSSWTVQMQRNFRLDTDFWLQAESLLAQSTLFPDESPSANSPVLGVPIALFRLVLSVRNQYQSLQPDQDTIAQLQDELGEWEALVLQDGDVDPAASQSGLSHYALYKDSAFLYILIASLLLDQTTKTVSRIGAALEPEPSNSWQAVKMLQIIQSHHGNDEWATCFISNWPVYTVGFFMSTKHDQDVVRQELVLRTELTGFLQASRFLAELEATWAGRDAFVIEYGEQRRPLTGVDTWKRQETSELPDDSPIGRG